MNTNDEFKAVRFWLKWFLLTVVGWPIGFVLGMFLGHVLLGNAMIAITVGAAVGLLQWCALRTVVPGSGWWAPASTVGLGLGFGLYAAVDYLLGYPHNDGLGWAVAYGLGGLLAGVLQQRILRPHVSHAGWWILACAAGWSSSIIGVGIVVELDPFDSFALFMVGMSILPATVQASAMTWLLRRHRNRPEDAPDKADDASDSRE
jgi:hypothetical protein